MELGPILRNEGLVRVRPWLPPNCLEAIILGKMGGVGEILRKRVMVSVWSWLPLSSDFDMGGEGGDS